MQIAPSGAEVHFTAQGRDVFACDDDPDGDLDLPASTYVDSTPHYIGTGVGLLAVLAVYGLRWPRTIGGSYGGLLVFTLIALVCLQGKAPEKGENQIGGGHVSGDDCDERADDTAWAAVDSGSILPARPDHVDKSNECVYNSADIDASQIMWAHDMGQAKNCELIRYYRGKRKVSLDHPDSRRTYFLRLGERVTGCRKGSIITALLVLVITAGGTAWWRGRHHARLETCLSIFFPLSAPAYIQPLGRAYATNFRNSENLISEGGNWINGGTCGDATLCPGAKGSNVASAGGRAFGTQPGTVPPPYTDSAALVTGNWGSDQFAQIVVWWDGAAGTNSDYDEVEIRLRGTLAKNFGKTYNINCRVGAPSADSYIQMGRANGPPDDFTPPIAELKGPSAACQNGDVVTATIVGNVITAYINGKRVIQGIDSVITSGAPGFGFFHQGTSAQNSDFGISRFAATDVFPPFGVQGKASSGAPAVKTN